MWHPQKQFPDQISNASLKEKLEYFNKGFVLPHYILDQVYSELKNGFINSYGHSMCFLIGPTGVGKSSLARKVLKDILKGLKDVVIKELPAIYVEVPVHSHDSFSFKEFYIRVLGALYEMEGIYIRDKHEKLKNGLGSTYSNSRRSEAQLRRDLEIRLSDYGVKNLLVDEIQHIFKYSGHNSYKSLDILKDFSNQTGCKITGFGTYELTPFFEENAQLARRSKKIHFPSYLIDSSDHQDQFETSFSGLLAHIPMQIHPDIFEGTEYLHYGSVGCIGVLKEWCERALYQALSHNDELLTLQHFHKTALDSAGIQKMEEENKLGLEFFKQRSEPEKLVLKKKRVSKATRATTKPGKRKPNRDPVG